MCTDEHSTIIRNQFLPGITRKETSGHEVATWKQALHRQRDVTSCLDLSLQAEIYTAFVQRKRMTIWTRNG